MIITTASGKTYKVDRGNVRFRLFEIGDLINPVGMAYLTFIDGSPLASWVIRVLATNESETLPNVGEAAAIQRLVEKCEECESCGKIHQDRSVRQR